VGENRPKDDDLVDRIESHLDPDAVPGNFAPPLAALLLVLARRQIAARDKPEEEEVTIRDKPTP
jgi:hypothetical protein